MAFAKAKTIPENTVYVPEILLPAEADMTVWAVNACDQFTSDPAYWAQVEELTRGKSSTYHLIFPEIYLKDGADERIAKINSTMREYLSSGVFKTVEGGFVLVERTTAQSGMRTGLVICVDLEQYSYKKGDCALIRSTEETVLDRLPPRIKIRCDAALELPHIMLLYDDPTFSVLGAAQRGDVLYDFELNMGGGHIKGTFIKNPDDVINAFYGLSSCCGNGGMLFAVGDGNHSLAAAKSCWEAIKPHLSKEQLKTHPARYALCEAVNIYDPALNFHPIHRFIKTDAAEKFLSGWNINGSGRAYVVIGGVKTAVPFPENVPEGIRLADEYIASFITKNGGEVDYIHGDEELTLLTAHGAGLLLPAIEKADFFNLIKTGGNLPKKTFSLGEGCEKRYYVEAKKIK